MFQLDYAAAFNYGCNIQYFGCKDFSSWVWKMIPVDWVIFPNETLKSLSEDTIRAYFPSQLDDGPKRCSPKKMITLWWTNIAIENGHRNSGFSHEKWWFSIATLVYQRVNTLKHEQIQGSIATSCHCHPKSGSTLVGQVPGTFLLREHHGIEKTTSFGGNYAK